MSGKDSSKEEIIHREDDPIEHRKNGRNIRKAKHVLHLPFRKVKRLYDKKNSTSASNPGKIGCCLGFTASDSPSISHTSDPNDPNFSYDSLRALIEASDFYSTECNVHIQIKH